MRLKQLVINARNHAGFRRYAANTSWMFAEQILRMAAALLVGIWVARYLGPEQFGLFSYAASFATLFSSIAKLGLDSVVVRDLVRQTELRDVYMGTAFWLKLIGAVVMLCSVGIAMQFTSSDSTTKLYILIIASGAIFQSFEVVDFYFQSRVLSKFVSICKLTQLFISSLLKLYLIYTGSGLFWFVVVSLFDQITLAITLYLVYKYQKIVGFFGHFDRQVARQLLSESWPLILSGLVVTIYMRIDQIMIKEMLGEKEVGLYAAAIRLSEVWYFVPTLIANSLFPSIVRAKQNNEKQYLLRLQRLLTFLVWVGIVVSALITLFGSWAVTFLYGDVYHGASQVLMIHAWGGVFVALGVVSGYWYINENLQRYAFYRTALGAILNILLNLVLISMYGISGAAIATVVSQSVAALFFDVLTNKTRAIFAMKVRTLLLAGFVFGGRDA